MHKCTYIDIQYILFRDAVKKRPAASESGTPAMKPPAASSAAAVVLLSDSEDQSVANGSSEVSSEEGSALESKASDVGADPLAAYKLAVKAHFGDDAFAVLENLGAEWWPRSEKQLKGKQGYTVSASCGSAFSLRLSMCTITYV